MSAEIIPIRRSTAEAAWAVYVGLLDQFESSPGLRRNLAFNIAMVKAWREFRDALIAEGRA